MDVLPRECLDKIVSLLDVESLACLSLTDHYVRDFVQSPRYWQYVDLSNNTRADIFLKYLANCYGDVVKVINLKDVQSLKKDIKSHINNFSCLERIICDKEDREINEHVVINRMMKTAQKMLKSIQEDNQANHSAIWKDLQVRQARVLLWDALWIALANKHGVKFVLKEEKHFQNIYHDSHLSASIISWLLDTEQLMCKPDLQLFPKSLILPEKIEMMVFITDPRSNNMYLAIGIEYKILLWDVQLRRFVKTFHTVLTKTTEPHRLRTFDNPWTGIVVNFDREEQPIIIAATSGRVYCWHFDTSSLIYERKLNGEYDTKTHIALAKNENFLPVLLIQDNSYGCVIMDPYTGQFIKELPRVAKLQAHTCLTNEGKFITIKKSKEDGHKTLTVKIQNIFTEKQELVQQIDGDFTFQNAQEKCRTFGDELIAVNEDGAGFVWKIYRRFIDEATGVIEYKQIQSIEQKLPSDLRFLSKDLVAACEDIFDITTGSQRCSIKVEPYSLEHPPMAYDDQTKLFARAIEQRVALLCNVTSGQNQLEDSHPRIVPNKFTRFRDTLLFHEIYRPFEEKDSSSYITLKITRNESGSNKSNQLPYNVEYMGTFKEEGVLIDVTQDKYGLISERKAQQETFKVVDMDTKTVVWQHVVKIRQVTDYGDCNDEDTTGALFVPQSDHVIVHIPGGGFMLFDWKENRPIIQLENRKFLWPLKLSPTGRYYAMETSVVSTRTLVYNRVEKSLVLLDFTGCIEAIDFNPSNEDQLAYAGCGVKIVDLKKKIQIKELTRFIDGQVEVLRESESIRFVRYSPSGKHLAAIEKPSRKPWGLNIAPPILRVYETDNWTMVTCLDLDNAAEALYWLDDEHALIGSTDGKLYQMRIVVPEFAHLFKYIIPPNQGGEIAVKDVSSYLIDDGPDSAEEDFDYLFD